MNMLSQLTLTLPCENYAQSYLNCVAEMRALGEKVWEATALRDGENIRQFVARLLRAETDPEPGLVPETTYWAVLNDEVVGRIAVRHVLNKDLEEFGGHIGYEVRPSARKKGVATEMLRLVLQTPKAKEIGRLLLTCAPNNVASNRTIQKNGGVLTGTKFVERVQRQTNYYWIELKRSESPPVENEDLHLKKVLEKFEMGGEVVFVAASPTHSLRKQGHPSIRLIEGLGIENDAHFGATVKHRSRAARDPNQANLRQVHLIHSELHDELKTQGFSIEPGEMGENITTRGIDLLGLPTGARLRIGSDAIVEVTGLRNPCAQLDGIQPGLMAATLDKTADGEIIHKAGIMGIVIRGGDVYPGDTITVDLPPPPYAPLKPV